MRVTLLLPLLLASVALAAVDSDLITNLPGYGNGSTPSKQYSGYISVDDVNGRYLHYWLVLSENNPSTDPLVLWMNGGPGCSSLDGYFYEQGPFHFKDDVMMLEGQAIPTLEDNPYRWNRVANMLFLEAPAGVGFSYSNTQDDYNTNDNKTAADNLQFLLNFFKVYPEFSNHRFFVSGESYAGIYVPTLVYDIYQHNQGTGFKIPLEGFLVGNGCIGNEVGNCGVDGTGNSIDFLFGHGLYSKATHDQVVANCPDPTNPSDQCYQWLDQMGNEVGDVNIYDIYTPCINGMRARAQKYGLKMSHRELMKQSRLQRIPRRWIDDVMRPRGPDACIDGISAAAYLNNDNVRAAIHVQSLEQGSTWGICDSQINYDRSTDSLLPIYPTLIKAYRTLIYNGDVDACVPYIGDEKWTSGLGFDVDQSWHQWMLNGQVAGYATSYKTNGFTFVTVKGSGHMVPEFRPAEAFEMFSRFLNKKPF